MNLRQTLVNQINRYDTGYQEEFAFIKDFLELLQHPRCFHRNYLPGHITSSAWIIDESKTYTLLTHHAKLNRWLQPGGHADGDENILGVALREAEEETGLKAFKLLGDSFFDIDIHTIPARKDFPEHLHYDIRFLLEASMDEKTILTEESHALAWKKMTYLPSLVNNSESIMRMAEKAKKLL